MNPYGFDPFGGFPFRNDPFASMREMMNRSSFPQQSMDLPSLSMLPSPLHQHMEVPMMMSPFNMFGAAPNMHQEMHNMMYNFQQPQHNFSGVPGSSFQSFTSISYGNGSGQPRVYQSSSSTKVGYDGATETRKTEKDSHSGMQKIQIGHHIGDRGHIIEKSKNIHTGDHEETQEYVNIEEEDSSEFNKEWMQKIQPNNISPQTPSLKYLPETEE